MTNDKRDQQKVNKYLYSGMEVVAYYLIKILRKNNGQSEPNNYVQIQYSS
jgi:hypothetical protein